MRGRTSKAAIAVVVLATAALVAAVAPNAGAGPSDGPSDRPAGPATVERRLASMGTRLHLRIEAADRLTALRASERAVRALEIAETRLSTWREDSELAYLNRAAPGEAVPLSPALAAELDAAETCWRDTAGAFDPTVGALAAAWGLRTGGRQPTEEERTHAADATGMDGLELLGAGPETPPRAVRRRAGLVLDEGGFGKGAGLRAALAALADTGATSAELDLGGQWVFWRRSPVADPSGNPAGGPGWRVAVADPRDRHRPVAAFTVEGGSVATSGNSERGLVVDGRRRGHLIDPRDGEPASDFGSLTVWTRDPLRADCLSTGLYVLGPDAALAWADRHPGVEALVLTVKNRGADSEGADDGEANEGEPALTARATAGLARRLEPLVDELTVETSTPPTPTLARRFEGFRPEFLPKPQGDDGRQAASDRAVAPKSRAADDRATSQEEYIWRF